MAPMAATSSCAARYFDLLWYLIRHKGRLIGKTELLEALWPDTVVEENNLNQSVSALRQALGDDAKTPRYIATVKGRGYQFVGEVGRESAAGDNKQTPSTRQRPASRRHWPLLLPAAVIAIAAFLWMNREPEHAEPATPIVERFADATLSIVTDYAGLAQSTNPVTRRPHDGLCQRRQRHAANLG